MKHLYRSALAIMLLVTAMVGLADEDDLCSPFKDGLVDESLVARMLSAADNGHFYRIQADSSQVGFCVDSQFNDVKGSFKDFQGGLALGSGDSIDGQTMVVIKTASLDTDGAMLESIIKSKRFFDVQNYPEILFVSTGFKWTSDATAVLKGDLTLHGVTKPVIFSVEMTNLTRNQAGSTDMILFKATTAISRTDFGMDTLSSVVNDTVRLCMSVEAQKHQY